jgi:ferredoxin-NADP reductase
MPEPSPVIPLLSGSFPARLAHRAPLAPGIVDLRFALQAPGRVAFEPGQFLTMLLPGSNVDGVPLKRSYSLASALSPTDELRFIARLVPNGPGSRILEDLPLGRDLTFTGPHGFFTLAPEHPGDVMFAATGTGMAALLPMLEALANQPVNGRRLVFWGVRLEEDLFARAEVETACTKAKAELHLSLSLPGEGWRGERGRIIQPLLASLSQPLLASSTFYLVGNGAMIVEAKAALVARGVNRKKQIRTEAFFD